MARFRSKVTEICCVGRVVAGDLEGYPLVRVTLETEESFMISPDDNSANGWSVGQYFTVYQLWTGADIIALYDEMPPKRVRFCGSLEAWDRYREVGLG